MAVKFLTPLLASTLVIAGCASKTNEPSMTRVIGQKALSAVGLTKKKVNTGPKMSASDMQKAIDQSGLAAILVYFDDAPPSPMYAYAKNGPYITFGNEHREALTFLGSVVTAARNLGQDLLSTTLSDNPFAGQAQSFSGSSNRIFEYLGNTPSGTLKHFECSYSSSGTETLTILAKQHKTTHIVETCISADTTRFTNDFWVGDKGITWKSRQYLGLALGKPVYINIDVVEPLTE